MTAVTFNTPGAHDWTVPTGVTSITVNLQGANGGAERQTGGSRGGFGGTLDDWVLAVTPGEVLRIYVGGHGERGSTSGSTPVAGAGGFNGGADSNIVSSPAPAISAPGGGGGATDIRRSPYALADRLIVAGGGGGGGGNGGSNGGDGGGFSGLNGGSGGNGSRGGGGGTSSAGGAGGTGTVVNGDAGSLGLGGEGRGASIRGGGGGGGGYYGGGGGGEAGLATGGGGGGGGSSYTGSATGGTSGTWAVAGPIDGAVTITYTAVTTAAPTADIAVDHPSNTPLGVYSFDGSGSTDPDGTIVSYEWDFGDDSGTATGAIVTHTYQSVGTYTVSLTVTDDDGLTDTATASVTVAYATVTRATAGQPIIIKRM